MAIYLRGATWWFKFSYAGRLIRESAKTSSITIAKEAEKTRRRELEEGFNSVGKNDKRKRVRTIAEMADEYQEQYELRKPDTVGFVKYTSKHVRRLLGSTMLIDVGTEAIERYKDERLRDGAGPATINNEI